MRRCPGRTARDQPAASLMSIAAPATAGGRPTYLLVWFTIE